MTVIFDIQGHVIQDSDMVTVSSCLPVLRSDAHDNVKVGSKIGIYHVFKLVSASWKDNSGSLLSAQGSLVNHTWLKDYILMFNLIATPSKHREKPA